VYISLIVLSADVTLKPPCGAVRAQLRALRAAVALLTRIPVGGHPFDERELRWSIAYLPLVGLGIGALLGAASRALSHVDALLAATVVICISLVLTGALHEDGLADTADALGGAASRDKVLQILKDSRIGSFGACALFASLSLRVAALATLKDWAPTALCCTAMASRTVPPLLLASLPYVTSSEVSKNAVVARAAWPQATVAVAITGAIVLALACSRSLSLPLAAGTILAVLLVALGTRRYFQQRVGGITGDFLGASQQIAECAILLLFAVYHGGGASP
jgi:adenosylcobinamide-GDP ribazoletransferase